MRLKYAEDFYIQSLLNKVKLKEVMSSPAISIHFESPFHEVARLYNANRIRHLPVVNHEHEVVGLITQTDLFRIQPPHKNEEGQWVFDLDMLDGIILKNVMIQQPFVLHQNDVLAKAIEPMVRHKYGCIPVVDDQQKLCGIITQYDLLKLAYEILREGKT